MRCGVCTKMCIFRVCMCMGVYVQRCRGMYVERCECGYVHGRARTEVRSCDETNVPHL